MNVERNQYVKLISDEQLLAIVRGVVGRYVLSKTIPSREREDVVMSIIEKFLTQRERIFNTFEGKAKFTTYCIAIVNRMCCEIIRKDFKQWNTVVNDESPLKEMVGTTNALEAEKQLLLEQEVKRLENIMLFFNSEQPKLNLFIKTYFNIPLSKNDIYSYANSKEDEVLSIIRESRSKSKGEMFNYLADVVNLVENKAIGGDAVRIWFTNQVNTLIRRLNGNGLAQHDKESLSILLELKCKEDEYATEMNQPLN